MIVLRIKQVWFFPYFLPIKWWRQGFKPLFLTVDGLSSIYYPACQLSKVTRLLCDNHTLWPGLQRPQGNKPSTWQAMPSDFSALSLGRDPSFLSFPAWECPGFIPWFPGTLSGMPFAPESIFPSSLARPLPAHHTFPSTSALRSCSCGLLWHPVSTHRSAAADNLLCNYCFIFRIFCLICIFLFFCPTLHTYSN